MTPVGWDVEAAKAAGTVHPSGREWFADDPDNPNANIRRALKKEKQKGGFRNRWGQATAKGKAKAKPGGKGKGRRSGKGKGQAKAGQQDASRVIKFKPPSKGKGRGRGKQK